MDHTWSKFCLITPDPITNLVATDYIIQATYTLNLPIRTDYLHLMPWISIEMTVKQYMPLGLDRCSAPQTSPAILWPYATMPLSSIPSHILKATVLHPIYSFALGLEASECTELQVSQSVVKQI